MPLVVGENSYSTVADADSYFASRFGGEGWASQDNAVKESLLITAADSFELLSWRGVVLDDAQPMAWPREGVFMNPRTRQQESFSGTPDEIVQGSWEVAISMLQNPSSVSSASAGARSIKVDVITLSDIIPGDSAVSSIALSVVGPYIEAVQGPAGSWWRAN